MSWRGLGVVAAGIVMAGACGGRTPLDTTPYVTDGATGGDSEAGPPTFKTSNKVDVLFAVQASASMIDAQQLIAASIPLLLDRLTTPWCIPTSDPVNGIAVPQQNGACDSGYELEFPAVKDLHVGIVSSSLGGGGSPDICVPTSSADPTHQDDHGHLLDRSAAGGTIAAATPLDGNGGNFLAWVPSSEKPNVESEPSEAQLDTDFTALASGVNTLGCGLQAQLESWYRFLVQPDPYAELTLTSDSPPKAQLSGVDTTILKMRHDFLRPDSMVLVINLTDKEDRWSDPMWLDGFGWTVRTNSFPGGPGGGAGPRGTTECDQPVDVNNPTKTGPNNPDCVSCVFTGTKPISGQPIAADPNCLSCVSPGCPKVGWYTPASVATPIAGADGINARYSNTMRARYGLDPMWNTQRYIDGLSSPMVPDRAHEVHDSTKYGSTVKNCTNPLFAQTLPDGSDTSANALCSLTPSLRDPSLVYYLVVGGVPWQLLAQNPLDTTAPLKRSLDTADWRRLVGADPATYQQGGIDPHMIESTAPRPGLEAPRRTYDLGSDPLSGREWNTLTSSAAIDFQFACVFDLAQPIDCTAAENVNACDCVGAATTAPDGPPLCDPANRSSQIRGKAYPSIRMLRVARGLDTQGIVASICPRTNSASYWEVLFNRVRSSVSQ